MRIETRKTTKKADLPITQEETTLYVGNLRYTTTEKGLRAVFSQFGKVGEIKFVNDPQTEQNIGIAFLKMATKNQANQAITAMNGYQLNGRTLKVSEAIPLRPKFYENEYEADDDEPTKDKTVRKTKIKTKDKTKAKKSANLKPKGLEVLMNYLGSKK